MTIVRLFGFIDGLARVFGLVLIVLGVLTLVHSFSSGEAPSDIDTGFYILLTVAGVATMFTVKKKTVLRRVIAGLSNGFICSIGAWMLFAAADDPTRPVKLVLGSFLMVACGLGVAASPLPQPRPDIVTRQPSGNS